MVLSLSNGRKENQAKKEGRKRRRTFKNKIPSYLRYFYMILTRIIQPCTAKKKKKKKINVHEYYTLLNRVSRFNSREINNCRSKVRFNLIGERDRDRTNSQLTSRVVVEQRKSNEAIQIGGGKISRFLVPLIRSHRGRDFQRTIVSRTTSVSSHSSR